MTRKCRNIEVEKMKLVIGKQPVRVICNTLTVFNNCNYYAINDWGVLKYYV